VGGKKVEVEVPDGYKLIQDGLEIKFVEQNGNWDSKDKISGSSSNHSGSQSLLKSASC
jgi:hypothetical protein